MKRALRDDPAKKYGSQVTIFIISSYILPDKIKETA